MDSIRIGRVSSIDYTTGMLRVVYTDRDNAVTNTLPYLSHNGEYAMPAIEDLVLVLHLSNGSAMAVVLGTFWSKAHPPAESGKGLYLKKIGDGAHLKYKNGQLTIKANKVVIETDKGTTEL